MKSNIYKPIICLLLISLCILTSCSVDQQEKSLIINSSFSKNDGKGLVPTTINSSYPDTEFAVLSDIHYYDKSLGTSGSAFETLSKSERKLLQYSEQFTDYSIKRIIDSKVKFVLITGDLTKDGELVNHERVSEELNKLTDNGIKVYVVPGNHDINNPNAYRYTGNTKTAVPNITSKQFVQIYNNFGYSNAVMRDKSSLSYVAEPVQGLWIVAMDSCSYKLNRIFKKEIPSGEITPMEEKWLNSVFLKANLEGKKVIVIEHHGVIEHWKGQKKASPDYLLKNYKQFGKFLADKNVRVVFTGHYHAQDITMGRFGSSKLYDIETGSLITPPCPIRFCSITNNSLTIKSESILDTIRTGTRFKSLCSIYVKNIIYKIMYQSFLNRHLDSSDSGYLAEAMTNAYTAHYNGDENPAQRKPFDESRLSANGKKVYRQNKYILDGLWNDLPVRDNNVTIDLK